MHSGEGCGESYRGQQGAVQSEEEVEVEEVEVYTECGCGAKGVGVLPIPSPRGASVVMSRFAECPVCGKVIPYRVLGRDGNILSVKVRHEREHGKSPDHSGHGWAGGAPACFLGG